MASLFALFRPGLSTFKPLASREFSTDPNVKASLFHQVSGARLLERAGSSCLIRMHAIPEPKQIDRWTEKRNMFGIYDNIGILAGFRAHPKDLIVAPVWLKGWRGNELERCIRKKKLVGDRMFTEDQHNLNKRIKFLYRRFNHYGKHR